MDNDSKGCSVGIIVVIIIAVVLLLLNKVLLWIALGIISLAIAAAIILIIVMAKKDKQKKQQMVVDGVTVGDVEQTISEGTARLQAIRTNYYKLKSSEMRDELDAISDRCKKIFKILKEDPKDIKAAGRFLNMLFTSLEQIINQSVQLFGAENLNEEGKRALKEAADSLVMLKEAADKQINKLYENNILDLDVEIDVLKKMLISKGLIDKDNNLE